MLVDIVYYICPSLSISNSFPLYTCKCSFYSSISWRDQVNFNGMMMRFVLFLPNVLSLILIVLVDWNNSPRVDILPLSDPLSWFQGNQCLLFPLNAACLAEKQQIPILQSLVWPDRGSNQRFTTLEASKLTITPPMRFLTKRYYHYSLIIN
jgi:hypothetical protein